MTTTTRMMLPCAADGLYNTLLTEPNSDKHPELGITLAGVCSNGKFSSFPVELLETIIPRYDIVIIEADGSKTLPLKAWEEYEPVITASTNITIGIMPLWPLGKRAENHLIHRLPLWTALTGCSPGETLTISHFLRAVLGFENRRGLFSNARGMRVLFLNQIEDEESLKIADEFARQITSSGVDIIIAGSIYKNNAVRLR